jgi:NhaA family Na+:H+ antiporter
MRSRLARAFRFALEHTLLMVAGAGAALVWANALPSSYARISAALRFPVNDVAMVFFFGVAVKDIVEATAQGGSLHPLRRAALPVLAAIGGMAGPVVIFVASAVASGRADIMGGWAVPCATDVAFSYLIARAIFGPSHPAVSFLLLLAVTDDALGLILLATVYPSGPVRPISFALLVGTACALAWLLRKRRVRSFWPYVLLPGAVSWAGFHLGGVNPALALAPIIPLMPRSPGDSGALVDASSGAPNTLHAFERWWRTPVEVILLFFALTNAGVAVGGAGPVTLIVLASLILGKPAGIVTAAWLAERSGLQRPAELAWRDLVVVGTAAGVGFTVALFFATAAFSAGADLDQAKLGALLSVSAAALALGTAKVLGVGGRVMFRA